MAVVTNDAELSARVQLESLGWIDHFEVIVGYDSGLGSKPDPGMVIAALERLETAADDCVLVGDTLAGVHAAQNAGVMSILVGEAGVDTAAAITIGSLDELATIVLG